MKKIFSTIAILAVAASSAFAQISVGAGYVGENAKTTYSGESTTAKFNGFYVGGDYNIDLGMGFGVAPGLYFRHVTNKTTGGGTTTIFGVNVGATGDITTKENYLSLPVNFNYGLNLTDGLKLSVYAGPTFDLGLSSKTTYTGTVTVGDSQSKSTTSDNYGDNSKYKRFDVLLGGGVALDIVDMIRVSAGYNWGLLNRSSASDVTLKRSGFHVGVAYLF